MVLLDLRLKKGLLDRTLLINFQNELLEYKTNFRHTLSILESEKDRIEISDVILGLTEKKQISLFNDDSLTLDCVLENLLNFKKNNRPLYQRFNKEINGKLREFSVPQKPLEVFLKNYVLDIVVQGQCHLQSHGCENGYSVRDSIKKHIPIGSILSFDLSNAFRNLSIQYVFDFYYSLILKKTKDRRLSIKTAGFLSTLSTIYYEDNGYALPQGSILSSKLFNRVLYPIDEAIEYYCDKKNFIYTRWLDDFNISSKNKNVGEEDLFKTIEIVRDYFPISEKKTYLQREKVVYLLGHKVIGDRIGLANHKELESRKSVKPF